MTKEIKKLAKKDLPQGFRQCEYCGCKTNAKVRACCDKGRSEDGNKAHHGIGEKP